MHSPDFPAPHWTCRWTLSAAISSLPAEVNGTQTEKWSFSSLGKSAKHKQQYPLTLQVSFLEALALGLGMPAVSVGLLWQPLCLPPPLPLRSCRDVQQEASSALPFNLTQTDVYLQLNLLDADIKGIWFQRVWKGKENRVKALLCVIFFLSSPVSPLCNSPTSATFLIHITIPEFHRGDDSHVLKDLPSRTISRPTFLNSQINALTLQILVENKLTSCVSEN